MPTTPLRRVLTATYAALLAGAGVALLWPGIELGRALRDPSLGGPAPVAQAWRWHRALTPAYADWARARHGSGEAAALAMENISGTEWPLFGTVFYLRATANLDTAWQAQPQGERPAVYAREAIDAAADLLADPAQSDWVQRHWGADAYLQTENVFYRMLLIDGLALQAQLLGDTPHRALLQSQAQGLAMELAASDTGLLADYPGQTFPADVAAAWLAIRRADAVLGTDHAALAQAGLRGFTGAMSPDHDLPPYAWYGIERPDYTELRGCANAWLLHNTPFVWPEASRGWFERHTRHFWQEGTWTAGYREFEHGMPDDLYADVDSGPVIAGLGTSATAFGIGAARTVGATREARILALEAMALAWPLPNGRLLGPRLMSDLSDAPLLGEAAMIYNLSQPPAPGFEPTPHVPTWRDVPGMVWVALCVQLLLGIGALWRAWVRLRSLLPRGASA